MKKSCFISFVLTIFLLISCSKSEHMNSSLHVDNVVSSEQIIRNRCIPYDIVDSHLHYFNFVSETDGFDELIKKMDESGVSKSVIFGTPVVKIWGDDDGDKRPIYYWDTDSSAYYFSATDYIMLEELERQPKEVQDRFFPFICGINPHDKNALQYLKKVIELHPNKIAGIGEIMSKHDDLTAYTYGEPPQADEKALLSIYDYAAEQGLPILIHQNITSYYIDELIYVDEMKNALAYNRNTKFIWAHIGISRRIEVSNLLEIAKTLLDENSNLYFDLSWLVYDNYINVDNKSLNDWASLIENYPDRFMIGTDLIGRYEDYNDTINKYASLVNLLSPETAEKLCSKNILSLVKTYD